MKNYSLFVVWVCWVFGGLIANLHSTEFVNATSENSASAKLESLQKPDSVKNSELTRQELFDRIRHGVVAIKVTSYLVFGDYDDKLWSGSGFIADIENGLVVTNAHVAGEKAVCTYEVKFGNGKMVSANLMYLDPMYDIAILKVDPKDIPSYANALKISEKDPTLNETIYAMGNSYENEFSAYEGHVFDTESTLYLKPFSEQSFQFSGLTVAGASGSPIFNTAGEVIGLLYGGKFVSGAALPVSYLKPVIKTLLDGKTFHRYFHGLVLDYVPLQYAVETGAIPESLQEEYTKHFPNSNNKILQVTKKLSAFGAENSKIQSGDIIWEVEGETIGANLKRIDELVQEKAGKNLKMTVYRNGKKETVEIPTFEIDSSSTMKFLTFAGATFFETTPEMMVNCGKNSKAIYIKNSETGSPFMEITNPSDKIYSGGYFSTHIFQIQEILGKKVSTLDELFALIPDILKKNIFNVKYTVLDLDSETFSAILKYSPEFASATLYNFDPSTHKWVVQSVKNPSQN